MSLTRSQAAIELFMSSTYAVFREGSGAIRLGAPGLPAFNTTPGRYMTELPPGTTTGSMVVHVCVARSSARVTTVASEALAYRTRPSGSTNMCGYIGMYRRALSSVVQ